MFGNVAACRHTLGDRHGEWMAALCGTCLAVRDAAGQLSRVAVTTDAVAASVLAHDVGAVGLKVRRAGPCPARAMLPATVWTGRAAAIGASISLLAAGFALADRADDGDLPLGRLTQRPVRRWCGRRLGDAARLADTAGMDPEPILAARRRTQEVERRRPADLAEWCSPVEDAYAVVFAACGLPEVGAAIGRATLISDAVADRDADAAADAPNPILAGACSTDEAIALVRTDLGAVASSVADAAPGSLSSLLWGPAWRRGVERLMAPVSGGASCRSDRRVPSPRSAPERAGGLVPLSGALAGVGATLALSADPNRRRRRNRCGDCCGDCCEDGVCCCCCCDASDGCDVCGCCDC